MPSAYNHGDIDAPAGHAGPASDAGFMFKRGTIWAVHICAMAAGLGLFAWGTFNRTALLTPVGPDFRAAMIGVGTFLGVLVAAVEREAWLLGIGTGYRRPPRGIFAWIAMAVLIAASGWGGNFVALRLWEWQAFHGLHAIGIDHEFTVVGRSHSRSGDWLDLQISPTAPKFSITCSAAINYAVHDGDRLILPVETGRGGVERVTLPPLRDLRRA